MKTIPIILLSIVSLCCTAAEVFTTYGNGRFQYSVEYPKNLLIPQGEAGNGDGQFFLSRRGDATLKVYGRWIMEGMDDRCHALDGVEPEDIPNITYQTSRKDQSVASGYRKGKIFYTKALIVKGQCLKFDFEYSADSRETYDTITARMAKSFKGY